MRGLYTAVLLDFLSRRFHADQPVDVGAGFDLIVGTSTGGILACGLALGVPLNAIISFYRRKGPEIFRKPTPETLIRSTIWASQRGRYAERGALELRRALDEVFGNTTLAELYQHRGIALCIPAVRMANQNAWVFKTPHLPGKTRDNRYCLTDICLATAAAPIVFPLAAVDEPSGSGASDVFVDGGLWANNPVLVGLTEALEITDGDNGRPVEILSVGTCAPPTGRVIPKDEVNWGLYRWLGGLGIFSASLDAQSSGFNWLAGFLAPHLRTPCRIVRVPQSPPSAEQVPHLGLDKADARACQVLTDLARSDALLAHSEATKHDHPGKMSLVADIFRSMPPQNGPRT